MTVRKISGVLPFIMAFVLLQPLGAQIKEEIKWSPTRPDGHAPIGIADGRTLQAGEVQFGLKYFNEKMKDVGIGGDSIPLIEALATYMSSPVNMVHQGAVVDLAIGLSDDLTVSAQGIWSHKLMQNGILDPDQASFYYIGETQGMGQGDLKVSALYKVLDFGGLRFHVHGGVSIPLGATDLWDVTVDPDDPGDSWVGVFLPYKQQTGSGSFELLPGFTTTIQNEKASLGIQWKGTIRLDQNDRNWALGDSHDTNIWGAYVASDWASVSLGVKILRWGNIEGYDAAYDPSVTEAYLNPAYEVGQAGWRVDVPMGVNLILPEGFFKGDRIGLEILMPIHQDLEYIQLRHNWTLKVGFQKLTTFSFF